MASKEVKGQEPEIMALLDPLRLQCELMDLDNPDNETVVTRQQAQKIIHQFLPEEEHC